MPWAPPVTNATRWFICISLQWLVVSLAAEWGVRVWCPVDRTGDYGVTGKFAAEHALSGAGRTDQGRQRTPGGYAHLLEHADQILRGDVSGGSRRHGAAAEFAEAGFKAGAPRLDCRVRVGQSLPPGVVKVGGHLDTGQSFDCGGEELADIGGIGHPRGVAEPDFAGAGSCELLGDVEHPVHRYLAL